MKGSRHNLNTHFLSSLLLFFSSLNSALSSPIPLANSSQTCSSISLALFLLSTSFTQIQRKLHQHPHCSPPNLRSQIRKVSTAAAGSISHLQSASVTSPPSSNPSPSPHDQSKPSSLSSTAAAPAISQLFHQFRSPSTIDPPPISLHLIQIGSSPAQPQPQSPASPNTHLCLISSYSYYSTYFSMGNSSLTTLNSTTFSSSSPPPISNWYNDDLLDQLHSLRKLPNQSLPSYFSEAKSLYYALAMTGSQISESKLIDCIVDGLDQSYKSFFKYYYFRQPKLSLNFLFEYLLDEAQRLMKSSSFAELQNYVAPIISNTTPFPPPKTKTPPLLDLDISPAAHSNENTCGAHDQTEISLSSLDDLCLAIPKNTHFPFSLPKNELLGYIFSSMTHHTNSHSDVVSRSYLVDSQSFIPLSDLITTPPNLQPYEIDRLLDATFPTLKVNNAAEHGLIMDHEAFLTSIPLGGPMNDENAELLKGVIKETYEKAQGCVKTNYYGTKQVTKALLPLLQLSNSARIVNVSSIRGQLKFIDNEQVREELGRVESLTEGRLDEIVERFLADFKDDRLKANGWPITGAAYKVSKAAVNAFTRLLAKEFPNMLVNCMHPGSVQTDASFNYGNLTAEEAARAAVMLALLAHDGASGLYFDGMHASTF